MIWVFDFSKKRMEGEEGIRTMECLRGRLLAERAASRVAKEETKQLGKKLIELENLLKKETKSKNRAEKRLKFLLQKLESLNISYVSDESSDNSSFMEKSEISSVSSTASSSTKQHPKTQIKNTKKSGIEEPEKKIESLIASQASTTTSSGETHSCPSHEENLGSSDDGISGNSNGSHSSQDEDNLKRDDDRLKSPMRKKEISGGNEHDGNDGIDNSLALAVVNAPVIKKQAIVQPVSTASVKDVLDALRYARESIQSSMETRHMIRVGSR